MKRVEFYTGELIKLFEEKVEYQIDQDSNLYSLDPKS